MARGNDPGKDFDRQFDQSARRARPKKEAGQGPWSTDKAIRDAGSMKPPSGGGEDSCALVGGFLILAALVGWFSPDLVALL